MIRTVALCLAALPAAVQAPPPLTLEAALQRWDEVSAASRVLDLSLEHARLEAAIPGLWSNPELSLSREETFGAIETFETLSLALPITGRLGLEKQAAQHGYSAAERALRQNRNELRSGIKQLFIDLLQAQERHAALEQGHRQLATLVAVLALREQEGESSGYDRMRSERELTEVAVARLESSGALLATRATLAGALRLAPEMLVATGSLAAAGPLPDRQDSFRKAEERGDVLALDAEAGRVEAVARSASRRALPEPSITAGRKTTQVEDLEDSGLVVGLGFSLPLVNHGQRESRALEAEAVLIKGRREVLVQEARAEVEAAYEVARSHREAETLFASPGDPEEIIRIAQAAYEAGEMRILELLDAYRSTLEVRLRALDLHATARRAEAALERAAGLTVTP